MRRNSTAIEETSEGANERQSTRSTKRLRAAVVGGGIGGLSAACALRRRGVDVMVFEQAEALGEIGAGLTIFPNACGNSNEWD